ncbi:MAG: glycosyltransferase [Chitinophagaceae bacterium]|jgi:glycosyltransferase involved in cell wall biosynthesis
MKNDSMNEAGIKAEEHFQGENSLPEILILSSYPPKECGIATYTSDLIASLKNKYKNSFKLTICPIENGQEDYIYPEEVPVILNTSDADSFGQLASYINQNPAIELVFIQHEFGFFAQNETAFQHLLSEIEKPKLIVFHTVLPKPDDGLKSKVEAIANEVDGIVVMTKSSSSILVRDYSIHESKITIIPHGTHLVKYIDKSLLKKKFHFKGKKILSTFGLLSSGKSIETTLDALPEIVAEHPEVLFLILGKTHPNIVKQEGEVYREMLENKVRELKLEKHVLFVNEFLGLEELLQYLQLSDIYLFTSKDPNQAVSGTFSYAMSCGCPIVSTPIPHAVELLKDGTGLTIDFGNSKQLTAAVNRLLGDRKLRKNFRLNALHKMAATAWENAATAHAKLFKKTCVSQIELQFRIPEISLNHIRHLTTNFGMIQFSELNEPDIRSGFTLDDNARALIVVCKHYVQTRDLNDISLMRIYMRFIKYCQQEAGNFLNYTDENGDYTTQNNECNLEDASGRTIWALGYIIAQENILPEEFIIDANSILQKALKNISAMHSTRAMAFTIKGLYYCNQQQNNLEQQFIIRELADRMVQMYRHETDEKWHWFEHYLTYANSVLPEALVCAWIVSGEAVYKEIALSSFKFLLSKIFAGNNITVVSNKGWLHKGKEDLVKISGGEQPIDVAYTIMALEQFYKATGDKNYLIKLKQAFNWFLGDNHLNQTIYNPATGGCYDGLEEKEVNLNQGAESAISYLMARLTIEEWTSKYNRQEASTLLST